MKRIRRTRPFEWLIAAAMLALCPVVLHGLPSGLTAMFNGVPENFYYSQPYELPAGSPGGKITYTGSFDVNQFTKVCFYTGYGSSSTPITPNFINSTTITLTVPADSIQDIPSDQIDGFSAKVYALAPGQTTCDGTAIDTFTTKAFFPIQPPTLNGASLTRLPARNSNFSTIPAPRTIILQGDGFLAGSTAVTLNNAPVQASDFVVTSVNTIRVNLPLDYGVGEGARFSVCTNAPSQSYCSSTLGFSVDSLTDNPSTLTANPNPTTAGTATTLTATFGDPTSLAGIPTGTVTFADGGTTLGTAPLKLASGNFVESYLPSDLGTASVPAPSVATADFNKDGLTDYALIIDSNVVIYSPTDNQGDFAYSFFLETGGDPCSVPRGVAAGDFNNDGYTDLAVLCDGINGGNVLIFLNAGDGSFSYDPTSVVPVSFASWIASGDFNKDGNLDLVVANNSPAGFTTLKGDGSGYFTVGTTTSATYSSLVDFKAVDLNGDGYPDLVGIQTSTSNTLRPVVVYQNDGQGNFSTTPVYSRYVANNQSAFRVLPRKLAANAYPDLVVLSSTSDNGPEADVLLSTVSAPGATVSYNGTSYSSVFPGMVDGALGDFDGDGNPDLVIYNGAQLIVYPASSDFGFYANTNSLFKSNVAFSLTMLVGATDLNDDGYPDVVAVGLDDDSGTEQYLRSFLLSGTATATLSNQLFGAGDHSLAATSIGTYTYASSEADLTLNSVSTQTTPAVKMSSTPASPITYGPNVTFSLNATVQGASATPTGSVSFYTSGGTLLGSVSLPPGSGSSATASLQVGPYPAGTQSFYATYGGDGNYTAVQSSVFGVGIVPATPTLTWNPTNTSITYGTPLSSVPLNAAATFNGNTVDGTYTYYESSQVTGATVLHVGPHTITATFAPTDSNDYQAPTPVGRTITVTQATPAVTYSPSPASISYGTPLTGSQLNASASSGGSPVTGAFTYTANGQTLTAGSTLPAGSNTITATFTPSDTQDYATASNTGVINVVATPTITYTPTPSSITYGTGLVSSQLTASATFNGNTVQGTYAFTYNGLPAVTGQKLPAGNNTIMVTFTPTDTTTYSTASQTAVITVTAATPTLTYVPDPSSMTYGTGMVAGQFHANATIGPNSIYGTYAYTVNGQPVSIGTVLPAGPNTVLVVFTPTDTTSYNSTSQTAVITVTAATPTITYTPTPDSITYGTTLVTSQLTASASFNGNPVAGTFAFTANGQPVSTSTVLPAGQNTITATFTPTDTTTYASTSKQGSVMVTAATPTVTYTPTPNSITYGTALVSSQLTASASFNGNSVAGTFAFTVGGKQVSAGTVLPAGTNTITAVFTPSDSTTYAGTSKSGTVTVTAATPTITYTPTPGSITYGTPLVASQLNGTASFNGNSVAGTFAYTVNGQTVTAGTVLPAGTNVITATFTPTDTTTYLPASKAGTVTVTAATPTIAYAPTPNSITYGTPLVASQLTATASFGGNPVAGTFTFTVNGQTVSVGSVLPAGTNTITAAFTPTDTTTYLATSKPGTVSVTAATPTITYTPTPNSIPYGTALVASQLNASASFGGNSVAGTFVYTVAGKVVSAGTVVPAGANTIVAAFTPTDANTYAPASQPGTINVTAVAPTITYAPTPNSIPYGTALVASQLNATASFNGNSVPGTFVYTVAGKAVAVGTVLAAGSNSIAAAFTPTDTTTYAPTSQQGTINVTAVAPTITYTPTPNSITYGTALVASQLNATASFGGNTVLGAFTYTVNGQPVSAGTVLTTGNNIVTAAFSPTDTTTYSATSKTASIAVGKATPVITWPAPAAITLGTALSTTQLNATATNATGATVPGTFVYSPAAGAVLPRGVNALSLTFTPTDAVNYAIATGTNSISVNPAATTTTVVSNTNPSQYGQAVTFTVGVSSTYTGAAITGPVSVFDGQTLIGSTTLPNNTVTTSALSAGTHTITAVYGADNNFAGSTSTALTQVVSSATTVINWPQPASIVYGTKLSATQLNATVSTASSSSVPGSFTYTPAAGTVLNAGTQTLSVTFTPTDANSYKPVTGTVSLVVTKANPGLSWATPAAITAGTPLSSTQLNATATDISGATLPGTFAYTPAAGTVPGVGTQILGTTFTPTDAVDYNTGTLTVPLTVNAATTTVTITSSANPSQYGQPVKLTATVASPYSGQAIGGSITFVEGQTTLGTGTVTNGVASITTSALAAGTHRIVANYGGDTNFGATTSQAFSQAVNAATLTLNWSTPAGITYGTPLSATQLNATVSNAYNTSIPGSFVYTPAAGTVLTAGTQTLSVTFTPTDTVSFQPVTGTVSLAVAKATPAVNWPQPAAVAAGSTLSATQLNATFTGISGTLPGTAVYTPAAGTLVNAGPNTLSVLFTPTDTANYNTASGTVTLNAIGLGLTSLSSTTATLGDPAKPITITGAGFVSDSTVYVDGAAVTTTFVNATTVTATVPASAFLTSHTVQVLVKNPTQNTTSNTLTISITVPPGTVNITGPGTISPTAQPSLNVTLTSYPVPVTATLTLTFTPASGLPDDPSVVFSNGTRTLTLTLPANTTAIPAVPVQGGSVAGTITITTTVTAGGVPLPAPAPIVITQPLAVPGISGVTLARNGNTLTVTLTGYSNNRNVDHIDFHFIPAAGEKLATTDLTIQGSNLFGTWFADPNNNQYGGTFTYTQDFNLDQNATVVGQVQVTLVSTQGASLTGSAQ